MYECVCIYCKELVLYPFTQFLCEAKVAMKPFVLIIVLMPSASLLAKGVASQVTNTTSDANQPSLSCFPGLVYNQKYNTCECVNASLFGEGIVCQTNQGKLKLLSFCVTGDGQNREQAVGGFCPYNFPSGITLPLIKPSPEGMDTLFCEDVHCNEHCVGNVLKTTAWSSTIVTTIVSSLVSAN